MDKGAASGVAMVLGMSALGYSVFGSLILAFDFFISFGGDTGVSKIREHIDSDPDLKASFDETTQAISKAVVRAYHSQIYPVFESKKRKHKPAASSRIETSAVADATLLIVRSAVKLVTSLMINVAEEMHANYKVILSEVPSTSMCTGVRCFF